MADTVDSNGSGDIPSPSRSKRPRIHFSCEECRRTKSKCDRIWPCSECVRKGCTELCPNQAIKTAPSKSQTISVLTKRIELLEEQLRRATQNAEGSGGNPSGAGKGKSGVRPYEMSAMLDEMALGSSSTKRYAGTEASPFYLASPMISDDEGAGEETISPSNPFSKVLNRRMDALQVPWSDSASMRSNGMADLPPALLDRCRLLLPSRKDAKDGFDRYWELLTWRTQPMTRSYFFETILPNIFDSPEGPHPHDLAVLFSTLALTALFSSTSDKDASRNTSRDLHDTAYSCLVAGRFFTNTTIASLIALQNIGTYMLNSDDRRLPDGNFAVFGLAVRLAIIAGYHRDPAGMPRHFSVEEMDMRRRIWHELLASDRLHSLPSLLPNSIDLDHYDTKLPSDVPSKGYFVYKWRIGVHISRVVNYWTSISIPAYEVLLDIDKDIRGLLRELPASLRCPHLPPTAFHAESAESRLSPESSTSFEQAEPTSDPTILAKQQIRLAMHLCMLIFYLHRPYFIRALAAGDAAYNKSVDAVEEACRHVIILTEAVMNLNLTMARWFSFAADLFSVLHCQTVLIVKTTEPELAASRMTMLERGVAILRWTAKVRSSSKNRALQQGADRLLANAQQSRASIPDQSFSPLWQDLLNFTAASGSNNAYIDPNSFGVQSSTPNWASFAVPSNPVGGLDTSETFDPFFVSLLQASGQNPSLYSSDTVTGPIDNSDFFDQVFPTQ